MPALFQPKPAPPPAPPPTPLMGPGAFAGHLPTVITRAAKTLGVGAPVEWDIQPDGPQGAEFAQNDAHVFALHPVAPATFDSLKGVVAPVRFPTFRDGVFLATIERDLSKPAGPTLMIILWHITLLPAPVRSPSERHQGAFPFA